MHSCFVGFNPQMPTKLLSRIPADTLQDVSKPLPSILQVPPETLQKVRPETVLEKIKKLAICYRMYRIETLKPGTVNK